SSEDITSLADGSSSSHFNKSCPRDVEIDVSGRRVCGAAN
ncbi:unnamed protein product, partial [Amoebophrya sp. A25]